MIIKCEKCGTKYNLEESLLKMNGSKVRCSVCRHVFLAYPPALGPAGRDEDLHAAGDGFEKTIALDSPPAFDDVSLGVGQGEEEIDFDALFEEPMEGAKSDEDFTPPGLKKEAEPIAEGIAVPAKKMTGKSHLSAVFLVIILILLGSGVAVYFFAPDLIPDSLPFLKNEKKECAMLARASGYLT